MGGLVCVWTCLNDQLCGAVASGHRENPRDSSHVMPTLTLNADYLLKYVAHGDAVPMKYLSQEPLRATPFSRTVAPHCGTV